MLALACVAQYSKLTMAFFPLLDLSEVPICESALSCDNLPRDSQRRLPHTRVVCSVLDPGEDYLWREHAKTEIVESSVNPQFLCTIAFRQSDGFTSDSLLRFTVHDVREKMSLTAVPLAFAEVALGVIQVWHNGF